MRVRSSKLSKFTAIMVAIILVVTGVAFSLLTYLGNNQEGAGDILAGNGEVDNVVAGAAGQTVNVTTADLSNKNILPDMAYRDNNGVVRYEGNGAHYGLQVNDRNENNTWAKYPTRYFRIPEVDTTYDLSNIFSSVLNSPAQGNRLVGFERRDKHDGASCRLENAVDTWNDFEGVYFNLDGYRDGDYTGDNEAIMLYFTIALPDNMVAQADMKLKVEFNGRIYAGTSGRGSDTGNHRSVGLGYNVIADAGDDFGISAPLIGSKASGAEQFNRDANSTYVLGPGALNNNGTSFTGPAWQQGRLAPGQTLLKAASNGAEANVLGINANTKSDVYGHRYDKTVNDTLPIPAGTKYLRFMVGFEATGYWAKNHPADFINNSDFRNHAHGAVGGLKLTLQDPDHKTNAENGVKLTADGTTVGGSAIEGNEIKANGAWKTDRYVDLRYNTVNNSIKTPNLNEFKINYKNPMTGQMVNTNLQELSNFTGSNITPSSDSFLYIVDNDLGAPIKKVDVNGVVTNTTIKGRGVNMRLGIRTGEFDFNNIIGGATFSCNRRTPIERSELNNFANDPNYIIPLIDNWSNKDKVKVDMVSLGARIGKAHKFKISHVNGLGESVSKQNSPEKLYWIKLAGSSTDKNIVDNIGSATQITGADLDTRFNLDKDLLLQDGSHGIATNVIFFTQDALGNITRCIVDGNDRGEVSLVQDGSNITNANIEATVSYAGGRADANVGDWYNGTITVNISVAPDDGKNFISGVRVYLEYFNKQTKKQETPVVVDITGNNAALTAKLVDISEDCFKTLKIKVVNSADLGDEAYTEETIPSAYAKFNGTLNTSFDIKRDATTPLFFINGDDDINWGHGIKEFSFVFPNTKLSPMFLDDKAEFIIEYNLDMTGNTWIPLKKSGKAISGIDIGSQLYAYMGVYNDDTLLDKTNGSLPILGVNANATLRMDSQENQKLITSFGNNIGFRIKYPNNPTVEHYYNKLDEQNETSLGADRKNYSYAVKLDNVVPDIEIVAKHNNDESLAIDEAFFSNAGSSAIVDGEWFFGQAGVMITIKNYGDILSRDTMISTPGFNPVTDLYFDTAPIYGKASPAVYKDKDDNILDITEPSNKAKIKSSINFAKFNEKVIINHGLGFNVVTGSGLVTKVVPGGYTYDTKNFIINYDNTDPTFTLKANGKLVVASGDGWFNKDAALEFVKTAPIYENPLTYTIDGVEIETDELMTELIKDGKKKFVFEGKNIAGKTINITYTINIDKDKDIVTLTDWLETGHLDNIKYVTGDAFSNAGSVVGALSPSHFYYVVSPTKLDEVKVMEIVNGDGYKAAHAMTFELGNFTFTHKNEGNGYFYIVSIDEAGNEFVLMQDENAAPYEVVLDNKNYVVDIDKHNTSVDGAINYSVVNRANGAVIVTGKVPADGVIDGQNIKAGYQVTLTALPVEGVKFLGYYDDMSSLGEDPTADVEMILDIDSKPTNKYAKVAVFKNIIKDVNVTNNIQRITNTINAPEGTYNIKNASGQTLDFGSILKVTYFDPSSGLPLGGLPDQKGTYEYRIEVQNGDIYWMASAFVSNLVITDRAVINIVFDQSNANKNYTYNNEVFLSKALASTVLGGTFIDQFATYATAFNEYGVDKAADVMVALKAGNINNITLTKSGEPILEEAGNAVAKNFGTYELTIAHRGLENQGSVNKDSAITDFDITFSLTFNITKRDITISQKSVEITKEYDGNMDVISNGAVVAKNKVGNYLDFNNLAQGENANVLKAKFGKFEYLRPDASDTALAIMTGVRINNKNYNLIKEAQYDFPAKISKRVINLVYTGRDYERIYNGSTFVDIASTDPSRVIGTASSLDTYWYVTNMVEGDNIFIQGDFNFVDKKVADKISIKVAAPVLVDVGTTNINENYVIGTIEDIANGKITRRTITIKYDTTAVKSTPFTGNRFYININIADLILSDEGADKNEFGIPAIFENSISYSNTDLGEKFVSATPDYKWNKGTYTITFGNIGPDGQVVVLPSGNVAIGDNYMIANSGNKLEYVVNPRNLEVKLDSVGTLPGHFSNAKYYDNKPIGGDQLYENIHSTNSLNFKVYDKDNGGVIYDDMHGYTLKFTLSRNDKNVGTYMLATGNVKPKVYLGDVVSDNFNVKMNHDNTTYRILPRPVVMHPEVNTTDIGGDRVSVFDYEQSDRVRIISLSSGITFKDTGDKDFTDLEMKDLIESINYNINFEIVDAMDKNASNAIIDIAGAKNSNFSNWYKWKIVGGTETFNNFTFTTVGNVAIKQAKYNIKFDNKTFKDGFIEYNDSLKFGIMPSIKEFGPDYSVYDVNNNVVNIANEQGQNEIKLVYHRKDVGAGDETYTLFSDPNAFGVGVYKVVVSKNISDNPNFAIVNIKADNTLADVDSVGNTLEEKSPYLVTVRPAEIKVTLYGKECDYATNYADITRLFDTAYKVTFADGVQDIAIRDMFDHKFAKSKAEPKGGAPTPPPVDPDYVVFKDKTTGTIIDYDPKTILDVGTYYFDLTRVKEIIDAKPNYKLTIINNGDIIINSVRVYVKFENNELTKVFDNVEVANKNRTTFYNAEGKEVTTGDPIEFAIRDNDNKPVTNAGNDYNVLAIRIKNEIDNNIIKRTVGEKGNYYIDLTKPFLPGTKSTYDITRAKMTISIVREDEATDMFANYDPSTFPLVGSFKTTVTGIIGGDTTATNAVNAIFGSEVGGNAASGTARFGYKYLGSDSTGKKSNYSIVYMSMGDVARQVPNYQVTINEIDKFVLTRKSIAVTIKNNNDLIGPTKAPSYTDANYDVSDFELLFNGEVISVSNETKTLIEKLLSVVPTISVDNGVVDNVDPTKFNYKAYINNDAKWNTPDPNSDAVYGGVISSYGQLYALDTTATYDFSIKKADLGIEFTMGLFTKKTHDSTFAKDYFVYGQPDNPDLPTMYFNPNKVDYILNSGDVHLFNIKAVTKEGDTFEVSNFRITHKPFVGDDGQVNNSFIEFTASFDFVLPNSGFYNVSVNGIPNSTKTVDLVFYVKKAEATITLSPKTTGNLQYGERFLENNFEGAISVAEFDKTKWGSVLIVPSMVFEGAGIVQPQDKTMGQAKLTFDKSKDINQDTLKAIEEYYELTTVGEQIIDYKKAVINVNVSGGYKKTYSVGNITDKTDTISAVFDLSNVPLEDDKYIFAKPTMGTIYYRPVSNKDGVLRFVKTKETYPINTLDVQYGSQGEIISVPYEGYLELNPAYFDVANSPLYVVNIKADITIEPCSVEVRLNTPQLNGSSIPYHYAYGVSIGDIENDIKTNYNVCITEAGNAKVVLDNTGYSVVTIELDETKLVGGALATRDRVLDAKDYNSVVFNFAPVNKNYKIARGFESDKARISIARKELYYTMYVGDSEVNNSIFTSVFGDVANINGENKLYDKADFANTIHIKWYEKSADKNAKYIEVAPDTAAKYTQALKDTFSFKRDASESTAYTVGKYKLSVGNSNLNYNLGFRPQLNADNTAKMSVPTKPNEKAVVLYESAVYEITPLTIYLDLSKLPSNTNGEVYGLTYDEILQRFALNEALLNEVIVNNNTEKTPIMAGLEDIVKNDLRNKIKVEFDTVLAGNVVGTSVLDAGTYRVKYVTNYAFANNEYTEPVNIIIDDTDTVSVTVENPDPIKYNEADFVISKKNIAEEITNTDMSAFYNGKFHDDSLVITLKMGSKLTNADYYITVDGQGAAIALGGVKKQYIKDVKVDDMGHVVPYVIKVAPNTIGSKNYDGEYTFNYTVNKVDLSTIVDINTIPYTYNGSFFDDGVIKIKAGIDPTIVKIAIDYERAGNKLSSLYTQAPTTGRVTGAIKNAGNYTIKVSLVDSIDAKNYTTFEERVVVNKKATLQLVSDASELVKTYGDDFKDVAINGDKDIMIPNPAYVAGGTMPETIPSPVDGIIRKYFTIDKTPVVGNMKDQPVGEYFVEISVGEDSNYTATKILVKFNINPKRIKVTSDSLLTGVQYDMATNTYSGNITKDGISVKVNKDAKIFGTYLDEINGVNVSLVDENGNVTTFEDYTMLINKFATYRVNVTYNTSNNVIVVADEAKLAIAGIDALDPTVIDKITPNGTVEEGKLGVNFEYTGAGIVLILDYNGENVEFNTNNVKYQKRVLKPATPDKVAGVEETPMIEEWIDIVGAPKNVGTYKAVITLDDNILSGTKEVIFNVNAKEIPFDFAADNKTNIPYNQEYTMNYTTDETYVVVNYYIDGDSKPLDVPPTKVGRYVVKATFRSEYAPEEGGEPNLKFAGEEPKTEFKFAIDKIKYTGRIGVTKIADSKVWDGKAVTIKVDSSRFSNLPEGATVVLAPTKQIKDVEKSPRKLSVIVKSENYQDIRLDYGTYEVKAATIAKPEFIKSENGTVEVKLGGKLPSGIRVKYSLTGEEDDYDSSNEFENLKPNTEYTIYIKVEGKGAKNFDQEVYTYTFTAINADVLTIPQIAIIAAGVVVVILIIVLSAIAIARKKEASL